MWTQQNGEGAPVPPVQVSVVVLHTTAFVLEQIGIAQFAHNNSRHIRS